MALVEVAAVQPAVIDLAVELLDRKPVLLLLQPFQDGLPALPVEVVNFLLQPFPRVLGLTQHAGLPGERVPGMLLALQTSGLEFLDEEFRREGVFRFGIVLPLHRLRNPVELLGLALSRRPFCRLLGILVSAQQIFEGRGHPVLNQEVVALLLEGVVDPQRRSQKLVELLLPPPSRLFVQLVPTVDHRVFAQLLFDVLQTPGHPQLLLFPVGALEDDFLDVLLLQAVERQAADDVARDLVGQDHVGVGLNGGFPLGEFLLVVAPGDAEQALEEAPRAKADQDEEDVDFAHQLFLRDRLHQRAVVFLHLLAAFSEGFPPGRSRVAADCHQHELQGLPGEAVENFDIRRLENSPQIEAENENFGESPQDGRQVEGADGLGDALLGVAQEAIPSIFHSN